MIDKVSEIAITDAGCAHNIGEFIIAIQTSISSTSDSNDFHSSNDNSSYYYSNDYYSSDYYYNYNFDFDIPEDTIDNVCAPNCRNQFDKIYQQCNDDAVSVLTMANCMYILVYDPHYRVSRIQTILSWYVQHTMARVVFKL